MTTQFVQQVPYTFLIRLSPDNSYFILCPREVAVGNNKCMNFFGYGSFADYNNVMPHYMPPTPVDFAQFGAAWCNESLTAYFNAIGLNSYKKEFYYEGVVYQSNGNNQSAAGINEALLVGRLEISNQIDTDFDNLFSNLISSLNTLLTPISQISLSLLGINNLFPTLVHNLQALNENNVPVSIAEILRDKQIDVDMSQSEISLDDTNLVTQLQNIYTILASQNSNQAAISSAITNKDNQSSLVQKLEDIFTIDILESENHRKFDVFAGHDINYHSYTSSNRNIALTYGLCRLVNSFLTTNFDVNSNVFLGLNTKLFTNLLALNGSGNDSTGQVPNNVSLNITNSVFKQIRDKISNIETKLEQNLPFTTLAQVDVVTDYTQVVKGVGKNE